MYPALILFSLLGTFTVCLLLLLLKNAHHACVSCIQYILPTTRNNASYSMMLDERRRVLDRTQICGRRHARSHPARPFPFPQAPAPFRRLPYKAAICEPSVPQTTRTKDTHSKETGYSRTSISPNITAMNITAMNML